MNDFDVLAFAKAAACQHGFEWSQIILQQRRKALWFAGPARWQFIVSQSDGSEFGVVFLEAAPEQSVFVTPLHPSATSRSHARAWERG